MASDTSEQPALGLATNDELLQELSARLETDTDIAPTIRDNAQILVSRLRLIFVSHDKIQYRTVDDR